MPVGMDGGLATVVEPGNAGWLLQPEIKVATMNAMAITGNPRKDMKSASDDLISPAMFVDAKNKICLEIGCNRQLRSGTGGIIGCQYG